MGSRQVPAGRQQYNNLIRSVNSSTYMSTSTTDLNNHTILDAAAHRLAGGGDIDGSLSDVDRDVIPPQDDMDDDEDEQPHRHHHHSSTTTTAAADCLHDSYRNLLPLHGVGVEDDRSGLEINCTPSANYDILNVDDILPIETARDRFLQIVVDHFIDERMIEVADYEVGYSGESSQEKLHKRNSRDVQYEGDPRFVLPLMYVANLYETLVNDVNVRLAPLDGIREKTIGVALEAAGGLYRRLAKKFPKKGPCSFRRRELATSLETRTRFPELVVQDQKRVRFVVVNGLVINEKPNGMPLEDADWFKRLTGRHEMAVSPRDYKFYSPRHKFRRVPSQSMPNIPGLLQQNQQQSASKHHMQPIQHQPQFHSLRQSPQQHMHQGLHASHFSQTHQFVPSAHLPEISHALQSPTMSQHVTCLQPLTGAQVGGRLHIMPTSPAKFCDGCGAPYLRETSKFCSECGVKRLGT